MRSDASGVDAYLADLPEERRAVAAAVIAAIRAAIPDGYAESMTWGMPTWEVPLEVSGRTYNGKPLAYVSFAAQKRHYAVYLMALYADGAAERDFRSRWAAPSGCALDMGKSCVRFTALEHADLPLISQAVAAVSVADFVSLSQASR